MPQLALEMEQRSTLVLQRQIDALIRLLRDIQQRHGIPPERVLAHSDIAPQRKVDPGPRFPWAQLVAAGVTVGADPQECLTTPNQRAGRRLLKHLGLAT